MRKILVFIAAVDIFGIVLSFFMLIGQSPLLALLCVILGIIGMVHIIALLKCLDDIERQQVELDAIRRELFAFKAHEKAEKEIAKPDYFAPAVNKTSIADKNWQCIKCVTVNKAGTSKCSNCGAEYDPYINPTE